MIEADLYEITYTPLPGLSGHEVGLRSLDRAREERRKSSTTGRAGSSARPIPSSGSAGLPRKIPGNQPEA
jgi:hypothetical protein